MGETYPLRVKDHDGQTLALCTDTEAAIALVCAAGLKATIWLGVQNPQQIFVMDQDVNGGAMMDQRGGDKLYHLAPIVQHKCQC